MDSPKRTLPGYASPPVNEVVLGVQFEALGDFAAVHPGLFWQTIRRKYPVFSAQAPLASVAESFDGQPQSEVTMQAVLSQSPPLPRCWFLDREGNNLIQLQADRFLHNWRKITGAEDYPHYANILPDFKNQWGNFRAFADGEGLGEIRLNHWEVTYVNHVFRGQCWEDFGDMHRLFPMLRNDSLSEGFRNPERFSLSLRYCYPEKLARLHVDVTPAVRRSDNALLIRFTLTARGRLESNADSEVYESFDFGHEAIVRSFTDLTSHEAHKVWKRDI